MPDKQPPDGGLTALAGYLYQTVGVLGMKAGAFHLENLTGSSDLEALLILAEQNEVRYEYLDQDAAIRRSLGLDSDDAFVLVQFKFSRQFPIPKITPSEFKKIVSRLKISTQRAQSSGQHVSGYALISNRELDAECQRMLDDAQKSNFTQQNREILRKLHVLSRIPQATWEDALQQFARNYGCVDNDIWKGIDKLVGSTIKRTIDTGSPSITKDNLIEAFTGYAGSRPLTPASVAEQSKIQLEEFFAEHHLRDKQVLVRRGVLDAISRRSEEHAIVILYGLGGNGKTVSLWHWTEEFLSSGTPLREGTYVAVTAAENVRPNFLRHLSCGWANLPAHHDRRAESMPEHVLERLRAASANAKHPILYLGIDAIDEEQNLFENTRRAAIKELLAWFWKEEQEIRRLGRLPRATIILSCRDEKEIEKGWLNLFSPFGDANERLPNVAINDFSDLELLEAARLGLSEELSARIEQSLT